MSNLFHPTDSIKEWQHRQFYAVLYNNGDLPPCLPNPSYMPHAILFSPGPLPMETNISMAVKNAKQFVETILLSVPFGEQYEIITHIRAILCEKQKNIPGLQLVLDEIWEPQYRSIVLIIDPLAMNHFIEKTSGYSPQVAFECFVNNTFLKLLPRQQAFVLRKIISKFSTIVVVIEQTALIDPVAALNLLELLQNHCERLTKYRLTFQHMP